MKKAILFDLMGTILVADKMHPLSSMYMLLQDHGLSSTLDSFIIAWENDKTIPTQNNHTPFEERIYRVSKNINWVLEWNDIVNIANDICNKASSILKIDNDAIDLLQRLQKKVKLGLVTNYDHPPAIKKILIDTGLDKYFSIVVISGEIGIWKPNPLIMQYALNGLSVNSSECHYVGDSIEDITAAISANIDPIFILRENGLIDPFKLIENKTKKDIQDMVYSHRLQIITKLSDIGEIIMK